MNARKHWRSRRPKTQPPRPSSTSAPLESRPWKRDDARATWHVSLDEDSRMNIQQMMKQAQQMQERLQKQMADLRVEATAGGGMVTVVVNGSKQLQSIKIDPEAVSKEDVEMLQDLIVAAVNDAHRKVDEQLGQSMSGMLGGMKIPGL